MILTQPLAGEEEYRIMERVATGDRAAFDRLYSRYHPLIQAFARRIIRRPEDVEEVVADVFRELWEKRQRYCRSRARPSTYILTIVHSRCIDRMRRRAYRTLRTSGEIHSICPPTRQTPLELVERSERHARVRQAIARLDVGRRQLLHAAFYDGLSHTELAARFSRPLGSIKTDLRQSIIELRRTLCEQEEESAA